jgi:hypothetical protein
MIAAVQVETGSMCSRLPRLSLIFVKCHWPSVENEKHRRTAGAWLMPIGAFEADQGDCLGGEQ